MRAFIVTASDFQSVLRIRPFVPFRVVTSDGTAYDIRLPELVLVAPASVVIGYPSPGDPRTAARFDIVSMSCIARLESLSEAGNGAA